MIKYYRMYCKLARVVPCVSETLPKGLRTLVEYPAKTTAYHDVMHS